MRKLLRGIARYRMKQAGIQRINKKRGKDRKSYFSERWREYLSKAGLIAAARKKAARHARAREART